MRSLAKRILKLLGWQRNQRKNWATLLGSGLSVSGTAAIDSARLTARDPSGCILMVGEDSNVEGSLVFERPNSTIRIGARTHIGGGTLLDAAEQIAIGDDVMLAFEVLVMDHDSHSLKFSERKNDVTDWKQGKKDWSNVPIKPVTIGDRAWIGARVIILKGVTINQGGVVGAGSVVTKDVPPYTIVAGNPARVVRELTEEERGELEFIGGGF